MRFVLFRNIPLVYRSLQRCLTRKFSARQLLSVLCVQPVRWLIEKLLKKFVQGFLVDTVLVQGTARLMLGTSKGLSLMNTGSLRVSLLWVVIGLLFVVTILT